MFMVPIELPKAIKAYQSNKDDKLLQWMMFLDNPENMEVSKIMSENKDIKEAKEELDELSKDDILRRMAMKADFERMDYNQRLYEARRDGKAEGKAEGKLEGEIEKCLELAKKMLEEGIDLETIMKITGLSKEEIIAE